MQIDHLFKVCVLDYTSPSADYQGLFGVEVRNGQILMDQPEWILVLEMTAGHISSLPL